MPIESFPKRSAASEEKRLVMLLDTVRSTLARSPYYRALRIPPEKIRSLDDLRRIPLTFKEDLRAHGTRFVAVDRERFADFTSTSGTTGKPTYMPLTRGDLDRVARWGAQTLRLAGLTRSDVVHLTLPLGQFMWMAGWGFYLCYAKAGCSVVRFGPGFTRRSLETMKDLEATALHGTPSFLAHLGEEARRGPQAPPVVKRVLSIGENVLARDLGRNPLGARIESLWRAELFSCYGATEGPFLMAECAARRGHHCHPFELFLEVLEPGSWKPCPPGKDGVVVVTPLGVEGFPLLRYVTGDISFLVTGDCPCGHHWERLGPILGRMDERMKIKGVNVFPETLKDLVHQDPAVRLYQIEAFTEGYIDSVRIYVDADGDGAVKALGRRIEESLGFTAAVVPLDGAQMRSRVFSGDAVKPVRFVDRRLKTDEKG